MASTVEKIMKNMAPHEESLQSKVTVVGTGAVGMACASALLAQEISKNIVLLDMDANKVAGEVMDMQHSTTFLNNSKVSGGTDYALSAGSRICVVTAGVRQQEGETRLDLVQRNTEVLKMIIPQLAKNSPDCVLLIVSNPVDVLTYVAWKLSGFPPTRVLGSGCDLDSGRFRVLMGQKLGIAASSIHGWIIGEHGDSSVAVWSGVNIAGMFLKDIHPEMGTDGDPEKFKEVHQNVVQGAYDVIKLKGFTNWAIGYHVSGICSTIINNTYQIHCVTVNVKGFHGISDDVFVSLPAVVGKQGIYDIVVQNISEEEQKKMQESASLLNTVQKDIKF